MTWPQLLGAAERVVGEAIAELPSDIQAEAQKVPVIYQPFCEEDPEILGRYGHFELDAVSPANGPIVLYLETIEDFARDEDSTFADEVRITYLHELGHHLGWGEEDLEARGLA
jgi:predicted Zn-dependent protease with MMP-like domain